MPSLDKLISLALELGGTDAVIEIYRGLTKMVRFSNNEITVVKEMVEDRAAIYVAIKEKRAVLEVNDVSISTLKRAVRDVVKMAKNSQPSDIYAPLPRGPFNYNPDLLKSGRIDSSPEKLVDYVESAVNAALAEGANRVAGTLTYSNGRRMLKTSGGAEGVSRSSHISISIRAFASDDATGHFVSIAADKDDFNPELAGKKAGEIAKIAVNPVECEPGVYEALLGPMVFADLLEQVGDAASAFYVDAGLSFLSDALGKEVASKVLTLVDDPTIPKTVGAEPFDDEGLPTKRNIIIDSGILKTYLHNSTTAKKFGVETTANAGLIVPQPFNIVVEGEGKSLDSLISGIDDGIYVTNNWYLRYQNYRTGDFSTLPRDGVFRVRKGSIEHPVKNLRISDNILKVLKAVREIGREKYWIMWWEVEKPVYSTYAVLDRLTFTKPFM
ncbi:MAG: TldD/PmbA family protein [Nitrososphaeria archaeon]|nr:TldD/PmbA family protein [Nitrososphaeria archaeon]MDW7986680.1 TldD/PmbA family protein [Nitrososphaerota archaeon]